jgi:hypothetical protein
MTSSAKIADRLIADSRGILTTNRWKDAADIIVCPIPVPHVMAIETYQDRFLIARAAPNKPL